MLKTKLTILSSCLFACSMGVMMLACSAGDTAAPAGGTGGKAAAGTGGNGAPGTGGNGAPGTGGNSSGSGGGSLPASGGSSAPGTGGSALGSGGSGNPGTGGTTITGSGGSVTSTGGRGATGGTSSSSGGATASGGAGPSVPLSATCKIPTWPTPVGAMVTITGTRAVTGVYDGKMALHEGTLDDCSINGQGSTHPIFDVADGGTVKNVIFGNKVGDGIHCEGSCTVDNVWFANICDDAVTMLGGSGKTATIQNSGFMNARDKTIQHNGDGSTVVLSNIYVNTAGKLYRSCGAGCSATAKRTVKVDGVVAIGVSQLVGVSTNDSATVANVCGYRTPSLCRTYLPGTETQTTLGSNSTDEGPSPNCKYAATDTHAFLTQVMGGFQTDIMCPGPNSVKAGATATACIPGFESCLKGCAPGSYGFKQEICTAGKYADNGICELPSDSTTATKFAGTNSATATTKVVTNSSCTTEWAWANDGAGKFCMCVLKPGYYQAGAGWFVWDCQSPWY